MCFFFHWMCTLLFCCLFIVDECACLRQQKQTAQFSLSDVFPEKMDDLSQSKLSLAALDKLIELALTTTPEVSGVPKTETNFWFSAHRLWLVLNRLRFRRFECRRIARLVVKFPTGFKLPIKLIEHASTGWCQMVYIQGSPVDCRSERWTAIQHPAGHQNVNDSFLTYTCNYMWEKGERKRDPREEERVRVHPNGGPWRVPRSSESVSSSFFFSLLPISMIVFFTSLHIVCSCRCIDIVAAVDSLHFLPLSSAAGEKENPFQPPVSPYISRNLYFRKLFHLISFGGVSRYFQWLLFSKF